MKNNKLFIFVMSLVLSALYCLLVNPDAGTSLYADKWMLTLEDGTADLPVSVPQARYRLKIKHIHQDDQERVVTVNGREYTAHKTRLKKTIRTDYFTIPERAIIPENHITVHFTKGAPQDIDVRLSNYVVLPNENLSYDIFVVFRSLRHMPRVDVVRWATAYLLFLIMLLIAYAELDKRIDAPISVLKRAARPFIICATAVLVHNTLPLSPFWILFTPFFFGVTFALSFVLMLVFIVPWRMEVNQ